MATAKPDRGEKAMSIADRLSRRRFLRAAGIAAGGPPLPRLVFAQNKKAVHFTLPWVAEGSNLFTFVAKGMGLWEKHGLDVDIARGSGSVAAAQAIGEARFDFGMCSPSAAILQTVMGLPTVALAACAYDATMPAAIPGPYQVPEMALATQAREQIRVGTGINIYVSARDIIKTNGMGYMEPKDYEVMTDLVMKYIARATDKRPPVSDMMPSRFAGSLKLTAAEWEQTQKNAQEFRPYVS